jgi:hypothetical protein
VPHVGDLTVGEAAADQFGDFALAPREAALPAVPGLHDLAQVLGVGSSARLRW